MLPQICRKMGKKKNSSYISFTLNAEYFVEELMTRTEGDFDGVSHNSYWQPYKALALALGQAKGPLNASSTKVAFKNFWEPELPF